MLPRLLFALLAMTVLATVLYFEQPGGSANGTAGNEAAVAEPGYVALDAQLVQTGEDGRPLYRLDASRVEQPAPLGTIFLTNPRLDYRPPQGNAWTLTALHGELPQSARTADLHGDVRAAGRPQNSEQLMQIQTDDLHVDMEQQVATTDDTVSVTWGADRLQGRGMQANLKSGRLLLQRNVSGVLSR